MPINPLKYYDETLFSFNTPDFSKERVNFEKSAAYREIISDKRTDTKLE